MYIFDANNGNDGSYIDGSSSGYVNDKKIKGALSILKGPDFNFPKNYPKTLARALMQAAETDKSIIFIDDKGEERSLSYKQLRQRSLMVLASLQQKGATPGLAVILQLDALDEFLISFWACVLGGLTPVPVLPFRNANPDDSSFQKLQTIASQLNKPFILMSAHNAGSIKKAEQQQDIIDRQLLSGATIATFEEIETCDVDAVIHASKTNDIAFLQYTSGSTSFPKGTQITHANVLATVQSMILVLGVTEQSVMLNWMPYYHDMGIIAGHIMAVVSHCKVIAMRPFTFVRRPIWWLEKIAEHRVSITYSPNFGLKRILEKCKPQQLTHLDLSCLEVILNGAEPISIQTSQRFIDLLHTHCRMPKECLVPGYGLAEASLAVSIAPKNEIMRTHVLNREKLGCGDAVQHVHAEDTNATLFADEGFAVAGMEIRVVDDSDNVLPVDTVGHVQIKGRSITQGYFSNQLANKESFCGKWFRTGDLGFVYDDRFIITGRVKDVVFVNGQNFYSHDFEHACEHIDGLDKLVVIGHFDHERNEEDLLAFVACNAKYIGAREKTGILRETQKRINQCFDVTPTMFIVLKSTGEIPKTTSGKIMRHKLLENYIDGNFANQCIHLSELLEISPDLSTETDSGKHVTISEFKLLIRSWWSEVLGISENAIGDKDPFYSLGGTSIKAIEVLGLAEDSVDCMITHDMFKEHDTISGLANFIVRGNVSVRCRANKLVKLAPYREDLRKFDAVLDQVKLDAAVEAVPADVVNIKAKKYVAPVIREDDVAIIGMGCLFPQANNVDEFWQVLKEGRDCVTEFPNDRANINEIYDKDSNGVSGSVSKWGSFVETHHFDHKFYNVSEAEAQTMDPHQRLFLDAAWQAIQDSGLTNINGSNMGVFVGASGTGFYQQRENSLLTPSTLTGALANLAAARVSNAFNLKGPSLSVDTACSSSLVSVDLAVKSLLNGESDTAIAGGVQVVECLTIYLMFSRAGILSPQGRCFSFSNQANGFVPGEGAGAVVLKRYKDAVRDGDRVYSVIKASATNNDGASLGIMAPNPEGQENIIRMTLAQADINPQDIGYVEAHGTGTNLGDLIEVRSLTLAYNEKTPMQKQSCPIGSVKTNMGHQLAAAGISGLMKTSLAVYHGQIPASLHCDEVNERKELKLAETPFYVNRKLSPWPNKGERRLAAVNSFGFGGTNAHVILSSAYHEEAVQIKNAGSDEPQVFCLSAKSEVSLDASRNAFEKFAGSCVTQIDSSSVDSSVPNIKDVAYTYNARRDHYRQNRIAIVATSLADAAKVANGEKIKGAAILESRSMPIAKSRVAWMFSGQGSQHPAMGKTLYNTEPVFREIVGQCDRIALPLLGVSLRELLLSSTRIEEVSSTAITQPLVFTMDYALARLWQSWGLQPDFMMGHSIGEYVAACVAGVFTLEDALRVVIKRGALMGAMPTGGGMTAVLLSAEETIKNIGALELDMAAYNGPTSTVVSGDLEVLNKLHMKLDEQKIVYQPLAVSHAFHSRHMEPMLEEFRTYISTVMMRLPTLPIVSNLTGELVEAGEIHSDYWPDYWVNHIRQSVQFHAGVQTLVDARVKVFIEVGAQEHLAGLAKRIINNDALSIITSTPKASPTADPGHHIAMSLARLYVSGVDISWAKYFSVHGDRRNLTTDEFSGKDRRKSRKPSVTAHFVSVPTYAMEKRSMFRNVGIKTYPFKHLFKPLGESRYEYQSDPSSVLFVDHVVNQLPMLSGAGQCDLICHLHHQSFAHTPKNLRNLSFHQPWLASSKLSVEFTGGDAEKEFSVTNAVGKVVFKGCTSTFTSAQIPASIVAKDIEQCLPLKFSRDQVYQVFSDIGIDYGSFHRKLDQLHASKKEAFAHLSDISTDANVATHGYFLHAGILDSAFQAAAGILLAQSADDNGDIVAALPLMVPLGIESINIFKYLQDGEFYSHVVLDEGLDNIVGSDIISCSVRLYDEKGTPIAAVNKLQMKRMAMPAGQAVNAQPQHTIHVEQAKLPAEFFHTKWQQLPLIQAPISHETSSWLVFGSPAEYERALSESLTDYGINSLLVPYQDYKDADIDGMVSILKKVDSISGIVFLGDHDVDTCRQSEQDAIAGTNSMRLLYSLLRAIGVHSKENKEIKRVRLIRATRNAYPVNDGDTNSDIRKSVVTGFLRTARIEFPLLDVRQIDFGNSDAANTAAFLQAELNSPESLMSAGPETLYNDGKRLSLVIEPALFKESFERDKVFNKDKVFWIIGGTSGVGRLLAQHLATNYQASLVLSGSRRLPAVGEYDQYLAANDDAISATIHLIRELEMLGSNVIYVSTDVRSADSMRVSLDTIRQTYKKIDGIYFSALQLNDMMIVQKEWAGYRNMMDMRVYGLHELIRQTEKDELDFFVTFSSCSGLIGNIGQSDYSASDVYMDAIPFQKHANSQCRYKTIQWGAWSLGQQVSDIVLDHMNRSGMKHVEPQPGMAALEKLILSDVKSAAFVPGTIDAHNLAKNLLTLRQGASSRPKQKSNNSNTTTGAAQVTVNTAINVVANGEEQPMSNSQPKQNAPINGGQMNLLMSEFEKQREMFMRLCENQNALLAGSLDGLSSDYVSAAPVAVQPMQVAQTAAAPVPVAAVQTGPVAVAPQVVAAAPAPAPIAKPTPVAQSAPVAAEAPPAAAQGRPENLFDFVASLMARAVEMHVDDIDPDQNIMELGADSMTAMSMVKEMETTYNIELPATLLFEYSTLNELVDYLKTEIDE